MKKLIFFLFIFLGYINLYSQEEANTIDSNLTPQGRLDNVFDQYGNKYNLSDIQIDKTILNDDGQIFRSANLCSSGIFNLYFENASGMENTSNSTDNQRRAVVCQVFQDISDFINSPLHNAGNNTKVNIWVRDINQIVPGSATSGVLGLATSFYNLPTGPTAVAGGITDNEIWKTIHFGVDSYTNVNTPIVSSATSSSSSGIFYHGMMAINFNNPSFTWNTVLTGACPANRYDLYSVVLHEVLHAMGFASLINADGVSKFGINSNYYSRYDRFLKNANSSDFLITNSGSCSMYDYTFHLDPAILHPGCTLSPPTSSGSSDQTDCTTAINYVGSTYSVPVYTPMCFEPPSSLSHFEDQCIGPPNGNNTNSYFTMTNANGTGVTKRFMKPEERMVLCDVGYKVNTTFGNASQLSYYDYGVSAACEGNKVAGVNDGFTGTGNYQYMGAATTASPIVITGILNNDYSYNSNFSSSSLSDLRFECLQDVYDSSSSCSITTGDTTNSISFTSTNAGLHLLRYIPYSNATQQRGNITYVYVYVRNGSCNPSACNYVSNGDFEVGTQCGPFTAATLSCWDNLSGTPDLFVRGCNTGWTIFNTGVSTFGSNPAADSHNGAPNNNFIGIYSLQHTPPLYNYYSEVIQTTLNNPLVANQQYVLSFWAQVNNDYSDGGPTTNIPIPLNFSSMPGMAVQQNLFNNFQVQFPLSRQIVPTTVVPNDNQWHFYSIAFTVPAGTPNHNVLTSYEGVFPNPVDRIGYVFVDDITIVPVTQLTVLDLPATICTNQSLNDLSNFLAPAPAGGEFTGPSGSITFIGGIYSLNAAALGVGTHTITYTYTNNIGCVVSIADTITVTSCTNTQPTFPPMGPYCVGSNPPLLPPTSINGISGTWNPAAISTAVVGTFPYTFSPNPGQNGSSVTINISIIAGITPTFPKFPWQCYGVTSTFTLPTVSNNGITGTWSPLPINVLATTPYTFTPDPGQCAAPIIKTIAVFQPFTPTFDPIGPICVGQEGVVLPNISLEGADGYWDPAEVNNNETSTYTFYPSGDYCAIPTTMTIQVANPIVPTFNPVGAICPGGYLAPLPLISLNGIEGHWEPDLNNAETITYTFYPKEGQCADEAYLTIEVVPQPTFNPIAPICFGSENPLPSTSLEGIPGTWSPDFDNTVTTTYTFTPIAEAGDCQKATIKVVVLRPDDPLCICDDTLVILAPETTPPLVYQRHQWIVAKDDFSVSGSQDITMHAGDYIELLPKTMYASTVKFYAYIRDCCLSCRIPAKKTPFENMLVSLSVFPNPSNKAVEILMQNGTFNVISIISMDGKTVYESNFKNTDSHQIDVSLFSYGIYTIHVTSTNGQEFAEKLIKN